jgi:hypothetical protein
MISKEDTVNIDLSKDELNQCINNSKLVLENLVDRKDLHKRDDFEKFNNILMGEIAEFVVLKWLHANNKYAVSSVVKNSGVPDNGHDIELKKNDGTSIKCSVKSSLSFNKDLDGIIKNFKLATTEKELRDVNIQVYFWLELNPQKNQSRATVPSFKNSAIIGWFGINDLKKFEKYNHEDRQAPITPLKDSHPMTELLIHIK